MAYSFIFAKDSELFTLEQSEWELVEGFIRSAERAGATVEVIPRNPTALKDALDRAAGPDDPVLMARPEIVDQGMFQPFTDGREIIVDPTDSQLESTRVGITDAFAGIARTGSVCVLVSHNLSGSVSLFTRRHIAVLETSRITTRPRDIFDVPEYNDLGLTRDFVFITGPSATADMGPLVHGVHGPGELHIILLGNTGQNS